MKLRQKINELERKVMEVDVTNEMEILREKIKNIEEASKQLDNITKNTEKIEEILTQLHNLESEYKTIIDGHLLKELKKVKKSGC